MKNFQIQERFRLQFRGEMFNAFNTPQFRTPNTTFGNPAFGAISNARPGRTAQLGLKLYF